MDTDVVYIFISILIYSVLLRLEKAQSQEY
jgi:hypothetical protein